MIMFFFWPVGFPLTHNLGFVQKHLAKTTTSQPHEPQPVHKVLKENLFRYIFSCLKCLLNTCTIFCIRLNSLWILRQRHNLFVYPWVYFPLLIWRCTPKPSWGLSMPLNPSVPLHHLLPNLQWGLSAWMSLSHRLSCHCMFITLSAWPWEHAWTQDMTGDTHTRTHIQS